MKTRLFLLTTFFVMIIVSSGVAAVKNVTYYVSNDVAVEIPVVIEDAPDSVPAGASSVFAAEKQLARRMLVWKQFDISQLSMPEPDADDIVIDTRAIFLQIMMENRSASKQLRSVSHSVLK